MSNKRVAIAMSIAVAYMYHEAAYAITPKYGRIIVIAMLANLLYDSLKDL